MKMKITSIFAAATARCATICTTTVLCLMASQVQANIAKEDHGSTDHRPRTVAAHKGSQAQPLVFTHSAAQASSQNTNSTSKQDANPPTSTWLLASERQGLLLQSVPSSGSLPAPKVLVKGEFELLAVSDPYVLTLDRRADRIRPIMLKQVNGEPTTNVLPLLPMGSFEIHWICIQPRQQDGNIYAWFGGENGQSEQWLLGNAKQWLPKLMRRQAIPVNSTDCAIEGDKLYVSEPEAGVWQFDASPFADTSAHLALAAIDNKITGLDLVNGTLLLTDNKGKITDTSGNQLARLAANKAKRLSLAATHDLQNQSVATLAVFDDQTDHYLFAQASLPSEIIRAEATHSSDDQIVEIPAWVESAPSDRPYDTMDDPAIWVHPTTPEKSLILGTNKRWGLVSFNMQGEQVQGLPSGRINNVDLRQQVQLGGKKRDIAVATLRDNESLAFYEIDSAGKITEYPNQATNMLDIYGMCLYQDGQDLYVFANQKSGRIAQYHVDWHNNAPSINLVRDINTPSQVEGCVTDESQHALFIGEEDKGIWRFDAHPKASPEGKLIIKAEGDLVADVEGISLYQGTEIKGKKQDLLVVSSQGNNSYLLYQTKPPYAQVGRFRIGVNLQGIENGRETSIDGSAETDGLAVTHLPVGKGAWQQGMLVVQDGHNHLPDANQSFKWLPWSSIAQQLQLN